MHDYIFPEEAEHEYYEAIRDYRYMVDEGTAERFIQAFEDAVHKVREHPKSWSPIEGDLRKLNLRKFPYSIIYDVDDDAKRIVIVAVAHHKQRPGYWRDRI